MLAPKELVVEENSAPTTAFVTCIALPDELIFVDTGVFVDVVKEFRVKMEKKFNRKTTHLLLTHDDWDHIFAMEAFKDVTIVATAAAIEDLEYNLTKGYLKAEGRDKWAAGYKSNANIQKIIKTAKLFLPNKPVKDELRLGPKGSELLFKHVGGHNAGSAIIYLESEKILIAGDNLLECYPPLQRVFVNPINLLKELEKYDIEYIIPGHGKVVDKSYLIKVREYYEQMEAFLKDAKEKNLTIEEVLKHPDLPKYFAQGSSDWSLGSRKNANWLNNLIKGFYKWVS
ncbi:MAG: MBL fold metallo-hydrolase [Candidatus Heimdallarchaeota archaeon]